MISRLPMKMLGTATRQDPIDARSLWSSMAHARHSHELTSPSPRTQAPCMNDKAGRPSSLPQGRLGKLAFPHPSSHCRTTRSASPDPLARNDSSLSLRFCRSFALVGLGGPGPGNDRRKAKHTVAAHGRRLTRVLRPRRVSRSNPRTRPTRARGTAERAGARRAD